MVQRAVWPQSPSQLLLEVAGLPQDLATLCMDYVHRPAFGTKWITLNQFSLFLRKTLEKRGANICIDYLRPPNLPLWVLLGTNTSRGICLSDLCTVSQDVCEEVTHGLVNRVCDVRFTNAAMRGLDWMVSQGLLNRIHNQKGPFDK